MQAPATDLNIRSGPANNYTILGVILVAKQRRSTVVLQTARGAKSHMMALRVGPTRPT